MQLKAEKEAKKAAQDAEAARIRAKEERAAQLKAIQDAQEKENSKLDYFIPKNLTQLKEILHRNENTTIVAGSTDVGLWVNKQFKNIRPVVFINQINALKSIKITKYKVSIGSLVTYSDFQDFIISYFPNLIEYINRIGGDQIRNMGTIGGNIANGSPIGDIAPLLISLGGKMQISSKEKSKKYM